MDGVDNINDALRLTFAKDYTVKVVYKGQEMGTFKWSLVYGLCNVESENPSVYVATNEDGSLNVDYSDDEDFRDVEPGYVYEVTVSWEYGDAQYGFMTSEIDL